MVESYLTAPTFTSNYEVDMSYAGPSWKALDPIMEATKEDYCEQTFFHSLCCENDDDTHTSTLHWQKTADPLSLTNYVNLAMAVGMDWWHLVVYNAEKMSLSGLVVAFKDVVGRTLDVELAPKIQPSQSVTRDVWRSVLRSIINQPRTQLSSGFSSAVETCSCQWWDCYSILSWAWG